MRSASRLYRLSVGLSAVGVGVISVAAAAVLQGLRLDPASLETMIAACTSFLPSVGLAGYVELAFTFVASMSLVLGARSLVRQLGATRRYLRELRPTTRTVTVDGVICHVTAERSAVALCGGYLRPRVYLSRGALRELTGGELRAVVAHESEHVRRRDPLRLLCARVLGDALFFLPAMRRIGERYAALIELAADEAAVRQLGERRALAGALLRFGESDAKAVAVAGIAPERVDHLSGDREAVRWRLPTAQVIVSSLAGAALLGGGGVLLTAPGASSVDITSVLAQSCMLVVTIGTAAIAVAGARLWRSGRRAVVR
jgi:hypothetical protein